MGIGKKIALGFITASLCLVSFMYLENFQNPTNLHQPEVSGATIVAEEEKKEEIVEQVVEVDEFLDKKTFGLSEAGKPIEGYEIGFGENVILLHASLHGDEIGTTDLMNVFVEELRNNPKLVATTTKLVIIPIANPDGYYDRTDKYNSRSVNLNLNFATSGWQKYGPLGTFAGEEPFSEKESQVLKQVVEKYNPVAMIAFHAEGALVSPESGPSSIALAKWYVKNSGYTYYEYWDYAGTATKWFEETYNKPAITVELTDDLKGDWSKNKKALLELASTDFNLLIK